MGSSPHPQRHTHRIDTIKRNIFQAKKDADHFLQLALQYLEVGNEALAEKAFSAEKACRENISALERELKECS
jgi:phage shock protein A